MRLLPLAALLFSSLTLACGGDDASSSGGGRLTKPEGGSAGAAGEEGEGGSGGNGFPSGGQSNGAGNSGAGAPAGGSDGGPACVTSPPELPACSEASGCQACLCDKCADAWADCMADEDCKKAVACVAAGCSLSQCGSLTSGEASLARAEAIEDCRASKQKCRSECTSSGAGGSGGSGQAGQGPGGSGGDAGEGGSGGAGGQGVPVETPQCCEISDKPGCSGLPFALLSPEEQSVEACVCAKDSFCCQNQWDDVCVGEIAEFGCAPACPAGSGGSGGSAAGGAGGDPSGGSGGSEPGGSGGSVSGGSGGSTGEECPPLVFPAITLQTKKDAALTAQYEALGSASCATPVCFLDASDLRSSDGTPQTVKVKVSANFTLYELIRTDIDPNNTGAYDPAAAYSARVLVAPGLVEKLQKVREIYGSAVVINSGYRSPAHQKQLCNSICGKDQCTDGNGAVTCAKNSRHMWGAAADMDLKYESAASAAGFPFVFQESGGTAPHLHVDLLSCL